MNRSNDTTTSFRVRSTPSRLAVHARVPFRVPRPTEPWQTGLVQACMTGIWIGCLVIGILGLRISYPLDHVPADPNPVLALAVRAELPPPPAPDMRPMAEAAPVSAVIPKSEAEPPPPAEITPLPAEPPMLAVAEPAKVAFAVPVQGPVRVVDPKYAQAPPATPPKPAPPAVQHLTFGVGQGQQPNPDYPREAVLSRQTGTVKVRFTVNPEGRVVAAELAGACRWPALNQSALRAVRERWRFSPGEVRTYEISIQFELNE